MRMNAARLAPAGTLVMLFLAGCSSASGSPPVAASSPSAAPLTTPPAASPVASSPEPVVDAVPTSNLPQFRCEDQSGGGSVHSAITAVRVGSNAGYDRFVVEFSGSVPGFKIQRQETSTQLE